MILPTFHGPDSDWPFRPASPHQKEDFLANLSFLAHEARNPLGAVEQSVLCLMQTESTSTSAMESYKRILGEIGYVRRLLNEVSEFGAGNLEIWLEPIELRPILLKSIELVRPMFEAKQQNLLSIVGSLPVKVMGDSSSLTQVFNNLLANASKFSPSHSRIEMSAHSDGDIAVVSIRDEGIGFDAKTAEQIFNHFFRGDDVKEDGYVKSVGLAYVNRLVNLHQGTVEAKSEGLARGCEFIVRLPISSTADA